MAGHASSTRGSIVVTILGIMFFLSTILFGLFILAESNLFRAWGRIYQLQSQYSAESGADDAIATLNNTNSNFTGTTSDITVVSNSQYKSTFSTTVAAGSLAGQKVITSVGKVYRPATATSATYTTTLRVTISESSGSTASGIVSRNILEVASGVKNLTAKNLYINGFIDMAKNTTNLIAENITVAGKNTGSGNCSIGGSGNLVKPASFTTPGQTKTNITVGYNNCISPPGNSSNSNFNVAANQGTIATVTSTYIPWSQSMDGTYQSAGSCNDWTTGSSPRQIPSTLGSKKTHYPDSGSGVSSTCGTSGDLALGSNQYNITDNVHVRASLCASSACTPTFYNPTSNTYFVYVEGTINFASVQTASGSGPIVFVTYGTDPSSLSGVCPYGGSIYLGNSGTTSAKSLYFMATYGVCLDKTKFSSNPALGGLGGKNIYIATNSGTPFDLALDTSFPVTNIPINLTWRAIGYERL